MSWDPSYRVEAVMRFIDRMTEKHGPIVHDVEGGTLDWGQALCRDLYGHDWSTNPSLPDEPPFSVHAVMARWTDGDLPGWMAAKDGEMA